jgi:hypothetical protein
MIYVAIAVLLVLVLGVFVCGAVALGTMSDRRQ